MRRNTFLIMAAAILGGFLTPLRVLARKPIRPGQCSGRSACRVVGGGMPELDRWYLRVTRSGEQYPWFYRLEEGRAQVLASGDRANWIKFASDGEHEAYPVRLMADRRPYQEFGRPMCARDNPRYAWRRSGVEALAYVPPPFA